MGKTLTPEEKAARAKAKADAKAAKAAALPVAPVTPTLPAGSDGVALQAGAAHAPSPVPAISDVKVEGSKTEHVVVHHHSHTYHAPHKRVFSVDVHGKGFVDLAKSFSVANPQPKGLADQGEKNHLEFVSESEARGINDENAAKDKAINDRRDKQRQTGQTVTP